MSFRGVLILNRGPDGIDLESWSSGYPDPPRGLARVLAIGKSRPFARCVLKFRCNPNLPFFGPQGFIP